MLALLRALWKDESGQDLAEYALLLALIALIVIVTLRPIGQEISKVFEKIKAELSTGGGS
jgi:pilus assembly protein Flp/PilA